MTILESCLRYLDASMVNSRFSKQWFCDRKAMKELSK